MCHFVDRRKSFDRVVEHERAKRDTHPHGNRPAIFGRPGSDRVPAAKREGRATTRDPRRLSRKLLRKCWLLKWVQLICHCRMQARTLCPALCS